LVLHPLKSADVIKVADIRKRMTGGFQPFVVRTSDGREFKVPHPEFIALAPNAIAVVDDEGSINTIALLHIASIKDVIGRGKSRKHAA
jgi:hypothetical protein